MPEKTKDAAYWNKAQETNDKRLRTAFAKGVAAAKDGTPRPNNPYKDKRTARGAVTFSRAYRRQWFAGFDSIKPLEGLPLGVERHDASGALTIRHIDPRMPRETVSGPVEPDTEALMREAVRKLMNALPADWIADIGTALVGSNMAKFIDLGIDFDLVSNAMNLCRYFNMQARRFGL